MIAPQIIKSGIFHCLKAGITPEFPEQGIPQGGVVSPLLANIALNGIENIHKSVRYADDMVFALKPHDDADEILVKVAEFLAEHANNQLSNLMAVHESCHDYIHVESARDIRMSKGEPSPN